MAAFAQRGFELRRKRLIVGQPVARRQAVAQDNDNGLVLLRSRGRGQARNAEPQGGEERNEAARTSRRTNIGTFHHFDLFAPTLSRYATGPAESAPTMP